jgi:Mg2+-importing ATPase
LFTQILVVLAIRTRMSPFWRSRPSKQLGAAIVAALAAAVLIPLSPLGSVIGFGGLPWQFWLLLVGLVAAYLTMIEIVKRFFDRYETKRPEAVARQKSRARLTVTKSTPQSNA